MTVFLRGFMHRIALVGIWLTLMAAPAVAGPLKCVAVCPTGKLEISKSASEAQMGFMVLQIANESGKPVLIDLFARVLPRLKLPDGRTISPTWQRDETIQPSKSDFVFVSLGRSLFVPVDFGLAGGGDTLTLGGSLKNDALWAFKNLPAKPAQYQMSLVYRPRKDDFLPSIAGDPAFHGKRPWLGEIETKPVSIEIAN